MSISDIELLLAGGIHSSKLITINKKYSIETRRKMGNKVRTPLGEFYTMKEAATAHNFFRNGDANGSAIRWRIRTGVPGYEFVCPEQQKQIIQNLKSSPRPGRGHYIRTSDTLKKMSESRKAAKRNVKNV
jgi:hypothetical protein